MYIKYLLFVVILITTEMFSQTLTISGKISDAQSGEPLPYGNVRVINTTLGTQSPQIKIRQWIVLQIGI